MAIKSASLEYYAQRIIITTAKTLGLSIQRILYSRSCPSPTTIVKYMKKCLPMGSQSIQALKSTLVSASAERKTFSMNEWMKWDTNLITEWFHRIFPSSSLLFLSSDLTISKRQRRNYYYHGWGISTLVPKGRVEWHWRPNNPAASERGCHCANP